MAQVTDPILLDSTGQSILAKLGDINTSIQGLADIGSNENGVYAKFTNGLMICYKKKDASVSFSSWGNMYESSVISLGDFAEVFSELPVVMATLNNSQSAAWCGTLANITESSNGTMRVYRPNNPGTISVTVGLLAVGRWQ